MSIVILFGVAMLFSCQNRINSLRKMNQNPLTPQTIEKAVNLVYTDSGTVALTLTSPKLLDFRNLDFPYQEFPNGVVVHFYDDNKEENIIIADYAIVFQETNLINLIGNVKITLSDSTVLTAEQLYWDRKEQWVFTDQPYTVKMPNGTVNNGQGFDANQKFTNFISRINTGKHYIEDKDK